MSIFPSVIITHTRRVYPKDLESNAFLEASAVPDARVERR